MCFSDLLWGDCLPAPVTHPLTVNDEAPSHPRTISVRCGTPHAVVAPGPPLWPCLNLQTIFSFKSFLPTSFCLLTRRLHLHCALTAIPIPSPFVFTWFLSTHLHFGESHLFGGPKPTVSPLKWAFQEDAGSLLIGLLDILAWDPPSISKGSCPRPRPHGFHFLLTFYKLTWSGVFWDFFFQYSWQLNPLQLGNQIKVGNWRACSEKRPENDCWHIEQRLPSVAQI